MAASTISVRLPRKTFIAPGVWSFTGQDGRTYVIERNYGAFHVHSDKALKRGAQPSTYIASHASIKDALQSV